MAYQPPLMHSWQAYPEGFTYVPEFITPEEEQMLLRELENIDFHPYVYEGYDAKRQIKSFTKQTGYPDYLLQIIHKVCLHFSIPFTSIEHAMVTEYTPGTQLGWHRDMPPFDTIIGISYGSAVPFRLRRRIGKVWERITVIAEPRSLYRMSGPARYEWQHSIPPVPQLRYSVTIRTS